jgi:drug/metabolite transporter (DMT)-like permease
VSKSRNILVGLGWAIVAIMVWSGSLVMLRLGMTTNLNAYDLTMLRFGVAAVLLTPVALGRGTGTNRLRPMGVVAMVIAFGAPYVMLISLAMKTAPAVVAGALNPGVMAIASVLLARAVSGDKVGVARGVGLALAAAGIALFVLAGGAVTTGHFILIVTGIMWAVYALIVRQAAVPALNATALVAVFSAIFFLPVYLIALPKKIFVAPLPDILLQAGFQGVLVSVVAIYSFNRSAELLGPVAGASLPALIPVVTLGLGFMLLGETASAGAIVSAIVVTLGLAVILVGQPTIRWILSQTRRRSCRQG